MDIAKIIETLKKLEDAKWGVYAIYQQDGDSERAQGAFGEYHGIWTARRMLENPEFAERMHEAVSHPDEFLKSQNN